MGAGDFVSLRRSFLVSQSRQRLFKFMITQSLATTTKFFEPTTVWLDWMKKNYSNRVIVDCGCGLGHVTADLMKIGLKCIPIDLYPTADLIHSGGYACDSEIFPFKPEWVPMFARPCHNGFVMKSVHHAIGRGVTDILYISKHINLDRDIYEDELPDAFCLSEIHLENIGEEEEVMWLIRKR